MARHSVKRIIALALSLVFLGAESGLPLLDAALEHRASTHEQGRVHVEATGNPFCHAENCILVIAVAGSRQVTNSVTPSFTVAISSAPGVADVQSSPLRPATAGTYLSRAPPAFS